MVAMYVNGEKIGTLADAERLLPDLLARNTRVELRTDAGATLGSVQPADEPPCPWDPTITRAELDRRLTEPGLTFDEIKQRMGWQ